MYGEFGGGRERGREERREEPGEEKELFYFWENNQFFQKRSLALLISQTT